jgi:hypothetical protein
MRIGFRYILPIVLTALYVTLIHSGYSREQKYYQAVERARAEAAKQQAIGREKDEITFYDFSPHLPSRGIQLALGANLPAGLAATPFLLLPGSPPLTSYWVIGVFVPFLWLLAGRWIDRRIGWLPPKQIKPRSYLKASVFALCSGIAAILSGLILVGLISGAFHHVQVIPVALALWLLVGAFCFYVAAK